MNRFYTGRWYLWTLQLFGWLLVLPAGAAGLPNVLILISDDQSWEHVGAYGADWIDTPNLDRLADEGMRFTQAYVQVPSCSTSRASFLLGREPWQIQEASTLWSTVPARYPSLMDVLSANGYHVGYTRKGWGPGSDTLGGRSNNPAGPSFSNFTNFYNSKAVGQPFCFWFGTTDPHRDYQPGSGLSSGKHALNEVEVPGFLPDSTTIRSDLLDYGFEIERFDRDSGQIIEFLESQGELNNTIIIVTSDNGMPFPGAKATLYDHGTRVPLIMRYPGVLDAGALNDDFIGFSDMMPTLLAALGIESPASVTGRSHWAKLSGVDQGTVPVRDFIPLYLERHSVCRPDMLGYPSRGIRTEDYLYIRNYEPDRWPAGDPPNFRDIDGSPSKTFLYNLSGTYPELYQRSFGKRPEEELYAIQTDPYSLDNLADVQAYSLIKKSLREQMENYLRESLDPRVLGFGYILESNPYTRGSLNENYGGVEVLGRYHPVRLAQFKDWLAEDDDGDAIPNLVELALFGDPVSDSVLQPTPASESGHLQLNRVPGVWPWDLNLLPVQGLPFDAVLEDDQILIPIPHGTTPSTFFRVGADYLFSAP
jgi:arylsulfatase A-like enzyme